MATMNLMTLLFSLKLVSSAEFCYDVGKDISGELINDGLHSKFPRVDVCINYCKDNFPTAKYFTWSNEDFFDPNYVNSCWCKATMESNPPAIGVYSGPLYCNGDNTTPTTTTTITSTTRTTTRTTTTSYIETTTSGIPTTGCCRILKISSEAIDASENKHINGYYETIGQGDIFGAYNYRQTSQLRHYLYKNGHSTWAIGDTIGENVYWAYVGSSELCPEDVSTDWQFYNGQQWQLDRGMTVQCADSLPPPVEEQCNTGADCAGCDLTMDWMNTVWCCKEHCDYGWIDGDPNNNPMCTCGV